MAEGCEIDPQPDPTETEFWMASKTQILWLSALRVKVNDRDQNWKARKKEGKKGEGKRDASAISREERHYGTCDGDLPWIRKDLWQQILYWGSKVFESTDNAFPAWKMTRTT